MYTILLILLAVSAVMTITYGALLLRDQLRRKPFPEPQEGFIRRATLTASRRVEVFNGTLRTRYLVQGTHVMENPPDSWYVETPSGRGVLIDPLKTMKKLWDDQVLTVEHLPIVPTQGTPPTPQAETPAPPPAEGQPNAVPPVMVTTQNVRITDNGIARDIARGAVLIQHVPAGGWQTVAPDGTLWTIPDSAIITALRNGWLTPTTPGMPESIDIVGQMQEIGRRMETAMAPAMAAMNRTIERAFNQTSDLTSARLNELRRGLGQHRHTSTNPAMWVETQTVTATVPKAPVPQEVPKVQEPASALDQILADDE